MVVGTWIGEVQENNAWDLLWKTRQAAGRACFREIEDAASAW